MKRSEALGDPVPRPAHPYLEAGIWPVPRAPRRFHAGIVPGDQMDLDSPGFYLPLLALEAQSRSDGAAADSDLRARSAAAGRRRRADWR
jgi:hypothetical protein